jgi:hypothetical protein
MKELKEGWSEQEMHTNFCWKNFLKSSHFEDRMRRKFIKPDLNEIGFEGENWIKVTQNHVHLWVLLLEKLNILGRQLNLTYINVFRILKLKIWQLSNTVEPLSLHLLLANGV